jgi:hypothetical protein
MQHQKLNILKKYFLSFVICSALLAPLLCASTRADVTLVDANTPPIPIITITNPGPGRAPKSPPKDTPPEDAAWEKYKADNSVYKQAQQRYLHKFLEAKGAADLAKYLDKISGKEFPVKHSSDSSASAIMIGEACPQLLQDAATKLGPDGFIIKTENNSLYICGGSIQGTLYGIYAFLEDQLGCRWWSWDEEFVPQKTTIKLGDLDIAEKPAFVLHDIMSQEAQTGKNNFQYKSRAKATLQFTGGNNTLFDFLRPSFEAHPEFLPMDSKGVRKFNNLHLNYLAPAMPEVLAAAMEKEIKKRGGNLTNWIYALGQGDDYGGLDQSAESKQVYADEAWTDPHGRKRPGLVAPLLRMANQTSELLQKKYPGIRVGIFPYMSVDSPPGKTVPGPNVDIYLPRLRYGTTLSIEEAASDLNTNAASRKQSQMIKDSIEQWTKLAPGRMFIWEYGVNYTNFVEPWPDLRSMAKNIKYYHKIGVSGVMIQANYTGFGGDLVVLKNWIWSKLLWNPALDVDALLKEFCDGYYGPASADIQDYVNTLEDSVRKPTYKQYNEFYTGTGYLTKEVRARLRADLKSAEAKTQGEQNADYYRRVREVRASLDALQLWTKTSTLAEKDGHLIRTDINKANGGEYTFPRAQELPRYLRGSGFTEFSHPLSQQRMILPVNGGPLYTLSHGAVTAKIAPYQGLTRLWKVLFNGDPIISGSFASVAGRYYEPVGTPTADKVEMQGELGYGSWDPKAYQLEKDTFTQDEDGTLHWNGQFEQILKGKPVMNKPLVGTLYPAKNLAIAQKYLVEVKTATGWQAVPTKALAATGLPSMTKPETPADFQLRITTPGKKVVLLDSYGGLPVTGYAVGFGTLYGGTEKGLVTYVQHAGAPTVFNTTVPGFERTIKFEAATQK